MLYAYRTGFDCWLHSRLPWRLGNMTDNGIEMQPDCTDVIETVYNLNSEMQAGAKGERIYLWAMAVTIL